MNALAHWSEGGGPGPWILLFPLIWAAVIAGGILLLRRTGWRGPWRGPGHGPRRSYGQPREQASENSPVTLLGRRLAAGEIDEDEYFRRLSALNEGMGGAS